MSEGEAKKPQGSALVKCNLRIPLLLCTSKYNSCLRQSRHSRAYQSALRGSSLDGEMEDLCLDRISSRKQS